MTRELRERVARALGWTAEETRGFSAAALREMVMEKAPKLAYFLSEEIRTGRIVEEDEERDGEE